MPQEPDLPQDPACGQHPAAPGRRAALQGGLGWSLGALLGPMTGCAGLAGSGAGGMGFAPMPVSRVDRLAVPEGYTARVLAPWGDPVGIAGSMPAFRPDASHSAADQALQLGMHHDGVQYIALDGARRGLLVLSHASTDDGLLHPGGQTGWSADKVKKAQAAHGISVVEVVLQEGQWQAVRPSQWARRITAQTPLTLGGPAAGHALLQTAADPTGRTVLGTLGSGACSLTPWGTCLIGEEPGARCFSTADQPTAHERRWGLRREAPSRWPEFDDRFDTVRHPHEPNRFGWVVEIDPLDPGRAPVKRTALGRAAHAGAWVAATRDGRAVVYLGDNAPFEYLYKFVSRDRIAPAGNGLTAAQANAALLDHGTLYVARFGAGGSGQWLPLLHGQGPLTAAQGFADAAEVLVKTRQAADRLGATPMDRPAGMAVDAASGWVCCALTGNGARGEAGRPGPDAANPRAGNTMGHIIRWKEQGDFAAERFEWNHLLLAGDPASSRPQARGNIVGDAMARPGSLAFDNRGLLWIGTDNGTDSGSGAHLQGAQSTQGETARLGNSALYACNPTSGEVRRFLTGPLHARVAGTSWAPDGRTLFVNIQHPGESPGGGSLPDQPRRFSNWPDFNPVGRPRSATVAIRRQDGGVIGS